MILPCFWGDYIVCSFFGGFSIKLQPTPQNTSSDAVPGKEVPFGNPDDYTLYLDP